MSEAETIFFLIMGLGHSIEWIGESLTDKKTVKEAFMIALGYDSRRFVAAPRQQIPR